MSKVVIIHPDLYNSKDNIILLESFISDVIQIKYNNEMTKQELFSQIGEINNVKQVAFIYHYPGYCELPFFNDNYTNSNPPKYIFWNNTVIDIIKELKDSRKEDLKSEEFIVDILCCNLNDNSYKKEVQKIEEELGINIRYSIDKTGNSQNGANWILESDGINVQEEYFTDRILEWNGILENILSVNLANDIKNGMYNNFITWDNLNKRYTVIKNFLWSELGLSNTTPYKIILLSGEIFDGNGKTIDLTGITKWLGLVGSSATDNINIPIICNLGILNGILDINEAGFIAGDNCNFIKIHNCYTTGNITRNSCGGIIGSYAGAYGYCEITNCYTTGNFIGNTILNTCNSSGGIAGSRAGSNNGRCIIRNCYTTGNLTERSIDCGGIVGSTASVNNGYCEINNCYTTGNIIGTGSGGIIGFTENNGTIIISNCYSLGINNENSGGIIGELGNIVSNENITVNNCAYNGGNLNAYENIPLNLNNNTNNLSVLNNNLYGWDPSIWMIGNNISVNISGTPTSYNLPILKAFQKIPWINKATSLDYYDRATNLAKFNEKVYSLFIDKLIHLGLTSERIDTIVTNIDNIPNVITNSTIIDNFGLNGIELEISDNILHSVRNLILDVIFNNSTTEFISTPHSLKLLNISNSYIKVINNNYLLANNNILDLSTSVSLSMPLYFYNPQPGIIYIKINNTNIIEILINDDKTKYTYNNIEYNVGESININKYTITFGSIIIFENPEPEQQEQLDIFNSTNTILPCCQPLIPCNKNPQTTNTSYSEINFKKSGQIIATNINTTYNSINNGSGALFAIPPFKTYDMYMAYLQSKCK